MTQQELQAFALCYRSLEGKSAVRYLQERLSKLDKDSRKMRGEKLLENTIKRDVLCEVIEMFTNAEEQWRNQPEKVTWE